MVIDIRKIQLEQGLALLDIITEMRNYLENMEFPVSGRVFLLEKMADIE